MKNKNYVIIPILIFFSNPVIRSKYGNDLGLGLYCLSLLCMDLYIFRQKR